MYNDPAVFNWSNFEAFAPVLFGRHSAPTWLHTGPFGLAITYAFDDAEGRGRAEYLSLKRGLKIVIFECEWDHEKTYTVCDGDWVHAVFASMPVNALP